MWASWEKWLLMWLHTKSPSYIGWVVVICIVVDHAVLMLLRMTEKIAAQQKEGFSAFHTECQSKKSSCCKNAYFNLGHNTISDLFKIHEIISFSSPALDLGWSACSGLRHPIAGKLRTNKKAQEREMWLIRFLMQKKNKHWGFLVLRWESCGKTQSRNKEENNSSFKHWAQC